MRFSTISDLVESEKMAQRPALVLMHVDSLDSYGDHYSGPGFGHDFGHEVATQLGNNMVQRVRDYVAKGNPVIIVDQYKDHHRYATDFFNQVPRSPLVTRMRFDEDLESWSVFERKIVAALKKLGATSVELGGIWYHPGEDSGGCAYGAEKIMRQAGFKVRPNRDILGGIDDYYEF